MKVSHKSDMVGPFDRGGTIINKTFTFAFYSRSVYDLIKKLGCTGY